MRKKKNNDWQYMYGEVEETVTREELIERLHEAARQMNSTVTDNGDGTFTFTTPDGDDMIVQLG